MQANLSKAWAAFEAAHPIMAAAAVAEGNAPMPPAIDNPIFVESPALPRAALEVDGRQAALAHFSEKGFEETGGFPLLLLLRLSLW